MENKILSNQSTGIKYFEGEPIVTEPPLSISQVAGLVSFLLFSQEENGYWLPLPGDPTRREFDNYDRVYYTYHVLSALLDIGFPTDSMPILKGLSYFDSLPGVSINYRPFYYLYLFLGKLSETQLLEFLRILQKYQINHNHKDALMNFVGSFLLPQGWIDESSIDYLHWQGPLHMGGAYFHAIHLGYFLGQISKAEYPFAYKIARDILKGVREFLIKTLSEHSGKIIYADGSDSPDLTLWVYLVADTIGIHLPQNHVENIEWAATLPVRKFMQRCLTTMNLARIRSRIQLPPKVLSGIENNLFEMRQYLDKEYNQIKKNPRDAAIALRTYKQIGIFFDNKFHHRLFSYLVKYFSEGFLLPEDIKDWT